VLLIRAGGWLVAAAEALLAARVPPVTDPSPTVPVPALRRDDLDLAG
jgi:hypothetical protein